MRIVRGIQLIELIMVIALIIILASFAGLQWRYLFTQTQACMVLSELLQTLQIVQSEAQARGMTMALCPSKDQKTCSGNWLDGFMIFINERQDGMVRDSSDILTIIKPSLKAGTICLRSFPRYRSYLLFHPRVDTMNDNSTFWYCYPAQDKPAWAIVINRSGRLRTVYPDKSGLIKDTKGQLLLCKSKTISDPH